MARIDCTIKEIENNGILLDDYLGKSLDNKESELYLYKGYLSKILKKRLREERTQIIEWFHLKKDEFPITLRDTLYEDNLLFGYRMQYYEESITLYDFLSSNADLNTRKNVALQLVKLYEKLLENKIYFYDWHSKNFLLENDIKFLDFDSCETNKTLSLDRKYRRYLLELCLSILIGVDLDFDLDFYGEENIKLFRNLINNEDKNLMREIPLSFDFIKNEINSYTNEKVCHKCELILRSGLVKD